MDSTAYQPFKQLHHQPAPLLLPMHLSVNRIPLPTLPDFVALAAAGVRRISMGNFLFEALAGRQLPLGQQIPQDRAFTSLFA